MGEVYEAIDQSTDRRVAVKILPAQAVATADRKARFLREGELAASIRHPNSLFIFGADEVDGVPYIAMELCTGGNLRELVEQEGPLDQKKAVDLIIQVCQGLTAAHGAGVIHRDIKPANCFLTNRGEAIVGDYGLSVSILDIDATQLSPNGSFVGTPAYASPEQIRGQELDVRADIYSVGASLFYLLSGETPFEGYSVKSLFTAILEEDPIPLIKRAPNTSMGLIKVISRCLHKDPSQRYQDYFDLIVDLEQFSSQAPLPVNPPRRILAGFIDIVLCQIVFHSIEPVIPFPWLADLLLGIFIIVFTGVLEGTKGLSPGKALLGIRVLDHRGSAPGLGRGLLRASIFYFSVICFDLLAFAIPAFSYSFPVAFYLVFIPARKRNSWSGFHERITNTRVVGKRVSKRQILSAVESELGSGPFDHKLGPYLINSDYGKAPAEGTVLLGFDPQLQRKVWIRVRETEAPEIPTDRRDLSMPFHLRWLNSKRSATESWDVYEALEGTPLIAAATANQPWTVVRKWLHDLVEASEFLLGNKESSGELTADRIWVTTEGNLVWLDFPAPGIKTSEDQLKKRANSKDLAGIQNLLLELGAITSRSTGKYFQPHYPLDFSIFQEQLKKKSIESMVELKSTIAAFFRKSVELNRAHRMKMMALIVLYPLIGGFTFALLVIAKNIYLVENHPQSELTISCLDTLREYQQGLRPLDPEAEEREWALKAYLAGPLRNALPDSTKTIFGDEIIPSGILTEYRNVLDTTREPGTEEIHRATEILSDMLENPPRRSLYGGIHEAYEWIFYWYFCLVPIWILLGIVFKGGVMYRIFGIAVVTRSGLEASRIRLAARTLLAWSPIILTWIWIAGSSPYDNISDPRWSDGFFRPVFFLGGQFVLSIQQQHPIPLIMFAVLLMGGMWAVAHPDRGLHDRMIGTYLVPR